MGLAHFEIDEGQRGEVRGRPHSRTEGSELFSPNRAAPSPAQTGRTLQRLWSPSPSIPIRWRHQTLGVSSQGFTVKAWRDYRCLRILKVHLKDAVVD
ncbi:hypothetical protein E2542_SST26850 [Spatholobus suberectus]|nr:hypothetical protein E2542_SST26850 [Spatholobus suberectus]